MTDNERISAPCRGDLCEIADRVEYWLYYRYQKTVEAGNLKWYLGEKYNTESAALDAAKRESERWYMSGGQYEYKVCKVTCKHEPIAHYVNGEKQ